MWEKVKWKGHLIGQDFMVHPSSDILCNHSRAKANDAETAKETQGSSEGADDPIDASAQKEE